MAIKNQNTDTAKGTAEPGVTTQAPELLEIGELRTKHKIGRAIFAGVCTAQGWNPGKQISEKEFLQAVESFRTAPMDGRKAKGSEVR